ncbi:MAG TPA: NnrS family protein, partial [Anaerolineae bacterium]
SAPIIPVRPYLATAFISLAIATLLNAYLSISTALRGEFIFPSNLDDALTHLMIYGFILPMTFALSIRNLPLFMRLGSPPNRALLPILVSYVAGMLLRLGTGLEQTFGFDPSTATRLAGLGALLEGGTLLVFIWQFDVLLRRKTPWTATRVAPPPGYVETRKPTRKNYPDYGEFGRFELLILSAYAWLAFASAVAVIDGAASVLGNPALLNPDIERHAITVGFITLLIFGMAARMLPGFSGKARVASTRLVVATFWLGNLAALCRVAPLLAPGVIGADIALGSSGAIGWLAVACLAVNLWRTLRQK